MEFVVVVPYIFKDPCRRPHVDWHSEVKIVPGHFLEEEVSRRYCFRINRVVSILIYVSRSLDGHVYASNFLHQETLTWYLNS
jgi:hypothetical protein